MLRIKSEDGEQAFRLMMQPQDTIGDVHALLAKARWVLDKGDWPEGLAVTRSRPDPFCPAPRNKDAGTFEIFSTFPPVVYKDYSVTLQDAGLVPNATLLLRPPRAHPPTPYLSS